MLINLHAFRHFANLATSDSFFPGISKNVCLAVTDMSVRSFQNDKDVPSFVHAVDPAFVPTKPDEDSVGYTGDVRIVDQLIWTDLYALHGNLVCQNLSEFWSLARENPDEVYTGPTTGVRRRIWRKLREEETNGLEQAS